MSTTSRPIDETLIPLTKLRPCEEAIVVDVSSRQQVSSRLAELGIAPGIPVRMLCSGRTCLVSAGRCRLSLRADELSGVLVERLA